MSGGSFDYLCFSDVDQLLEKRRSLQEMSDFLSKLGYAKDAALETEEIILMLNQIEVRIGARVRRLSDVWKAVEWWQSGDSGEDDLKKALKGYREE